MDLYKKVSFFYLSVILISFIGLFFWVFIHFIPEKDTILHYLFNIYTAVVYLLTGITGLIYYNRAPQINALKNTFLFFSASMISWALGGFTWGFYNLILLTENPYPSIADVFFILHAVFIGIAFWFVLEIHNFRPSKTNMKLSIIIIMLVYFLVFFISFNSSFSTNTPIIASILNFVYPIADSLLLTIAIIAFSAVNNFGFGLASISISVFLQAVGDLLFSYRQINEIYWNGDISDLFFLMSAIFMMIGLYRFFIKSFTGNYAQ